MARRERIGPALGLLTFLAGVGLMGWTFWLAYRLFGTPPEVALGLESGKALDVEATGRAGVGLVLRVVALLLMAFFGAMIATRGIKLYQASPISAPSEEDR